MSCFSLIGACTLFVIFLSCSISLCCFPFLFWAALILALWLGGYIPFTPSPSVVFTELVYYAHYLVVYSVWLSVYPVPSVYSMYGSIVYRELCFLSSANVQCYCYCSHFGEYTRGRGTHDHAVSDCCCGGDVYQEDAIKTRWVKWLQWTCIHEFSRCAKYPNISTIM